jgi:hypothetical protein
VERYLSRGPRAIHIANRRENAVGNDVAIFSGMKKCRQKWRCAAIIGNTGVKYCCRISRISAAANRGASLLEL